jgi:hypothetical protein
MSLHDRYNRDDGRIQRLDRRFTELGDRVGTWWNDATGFSRVALTKGLFLVSAIATVQHFILYGEFPVLLFLLIAVLGFNGMTQAVGGIVEQIQAEVAGLPKNTIPFFRLLMLMLGIYSLTVAATDLIALELQLNTFVPGIGDNLLLGIALISLQFSEYIRRSNPPANSRGGNRRPGKLIKSAAPSR